MTGAVTTSDEGLAFSMTLSADGIDIDTIQQALSSPGKKSPRRPTRRAERRSGPFPCRPIRANSPPTRRTSNSDAFPGARPRRHDRRARQGGHGVQPYRDLRNLFGRSGRHVRADHVVYLYAFGKGETPGADHRLPDRQGAEITGDYDLTANIRSHGTGTDMLSSLEGRVDFKARKGKIYQYPTLEKYCPF